MKSHPLTRFTVWPGRTREFEHRGVTFRVAYERALGDEVLAVVYPDPVEAQQACQHAAVVNGRSRPYPLDAFAYGQAILRTLQNTEGEEAPDLTTVLAVYDGDPELFQRLAGAALAVMGLVEDEPLPGGRESWEQLHRLLLAGSLDKAKGLTLGVLRSFGAEVAESEALGDPLLEGALGNSPAPEFSGDSGCASKSEP